MTNDKTSSTEAWDDAVTQPTDQVILKANTLLAERFRIVRLLGHGGQASIYEAFDTVLEQTCALKILFVHETIASEPIERLRNEVLLARQLQHPNVVRVHEFYVTSEAIFFTMSLIEGTALTQVLDAPIDASDCVKWFQQLLSAMQACHEAGIVHGDLKPANLVINADGDLIVVDFGIGSSHEGTTTTHFSAGYTAPELAASHRATHASDRYALGKILAKLLRATERKSWSRTSYKLSQLAKLAEQLQADEPEQRPSIASCFARLERPHSFRQTWLAGSALVLMLLLFFSWLLFSRSAPPDSRTQPSVYTLAIASSNGSQTVAQLAHLMLQADPQIYSVEPEKVAQLTEQLGIKVMSSATERSRLAEVTKAQYLLVLSEQELAGEPQLLALLLRYPGEQILLNQTYSIHQETPKQLAQQVVAQIANYLPAEPGELAVVTNDTVASYLEQLQSARAQGDQAAEQQVLKAMIAAKGIGVFWQHKARAELAIAEQQFERAVQLLDELIVHFPNRADLLVQRAQVASELGDLTLAREFYTAALAQDPNQPMWWFELAKLKIIQGDMQGAIQRELTQALVGFRQQENSSGQGLVLNGFGVAYLRLAEFEEARDYFLMALPHRKAASQPNERITTLSNLATAAAILGNYNQAEEALEEASKLASEYGDDLAVAHIENERGLLFEEQGLYTQSLIHYKRALDLRLRSGDAYAQSQSINNVAFINFLLGEFSLAEVYWRQAIQIASSIEESATLHSIQISLAHLLILQGQFQQAEKLLAELLNTEGKSPEAELNVQLQLSRLNFAQGRIAAAATAVEQSIAIARQINDSRGLTESLLWQAEMAELIDQNTLLRQTLEELASFADEFNQEQRLAFDWLQLLASGPAQVPEEFTARLASASLSRLLELKLLSELVFRFDIAADSAIWQRLQAITNETLYDSYFLTLAARGDAASQQTLFTRLQNFPNYWRNFELYPVISIQSTDELAEQALNNLIENMNEAQRQAFASHFEPR